MKKMATITNENGTDTVIMFDAENGSLYLESFGEPTMQTGPQFPSKEAAADYVHDSWGRGWNLRWADEAGSKRFEIGTLRNGNFEADTIGNDPETTTFDTLEEAIEAMRDVIAHAVEMFGEPLTNGAIKDSETGIIVWQQKESR